MSLRLRGRARVKVRVRSTLGLRARGKEGRECEVKGEWMSVRLSMRLSLRARVRETRNPGEGGRGKQEGIRGGGQGNK